MSSDRVFNLFTLMAIGVMLAYAVQPQNWNGIWAIMNGVTGIWGTIVNVLLGKPAPSYAGKNVAPAGTGGVHCTKNAGVVTCTKG